jgi:hypothetical protein
VPQHLLDRAALGLRSEVAALGQPELRASGSVIGRPWASESALGRPWTEARVLELAFRDPNRDHAKLRALRQGEFGALAGLLQRPQDLRQGPVRDLFQNQEVQELCRPGSQASHGKLRQDGRDWRLELRGHLATLAQELAPDALPPVTEELLVLLPVGETRRREQRGWSTEE